MKNRFKSLALTLVFLGFSTSLYASAWEPWLNEDEELNFRNGGSISSDSSKFGKLSSLWEDEDEELNFKNKIGNSRRLRAENARKKVEKKKFSTTDAQRDKYYRAAENSAYSTTDYAYLEDDDIEDSEIYNSINKWKRGNVSVFWENYRGNNIRIEMLRNNSDLKNIRLKFVQSQNMISDPDGSISDMLNIVANEVMKRTCGRKAKQSIILYERPSVELEKETAADDYKVMAKGASLKEYGFRCIY